MGRESQVRTLTPNFTVVALKMWAYGLQNCQKKMINDNQRLFVLLIDENFGQLKNLIFN